MTSASKADISPIVALDINHSRSKNYSILTTRKLFEIQSLFKSP